MADVRLIDANALLQLYKTWLPQLASEKYEGDRRGVETCITVLEDAPTIDPESLRPTGHWEESEYDGYLCSECGWGDEEGDPSMDYCPNCGAKME